MHYNVLPHGDPGAYVISTPAMQAIGPIYFNEAVQPDPTYTCTSDDGGVTWFNVTTGEYDITAEKTPYIYDTIHFNITEEDIENGVEFYIASPPDSIQGSNTSEPGEY